MSSRGRRNSSVPNKLTSFQNNKFLNANCKVEKNRSHKKIEIVD